MVNNSSEKQKVCIYCGNVLDSDWVYCPFCTSKREGISCGFCGSDIAKDWNYCPNCKKKITKTKTENILDNGNEWLREILTG